MRQWRNLRRIAPRSARAANAIFADYRLRVAAVRARLRHERARRSAGGFAQAPRLARRCSVRWRTVTAAPPFYYGSSRSLMLSRLEPTRSQPARYWAVWQLTPNARSLLNQEKNSPVGHALLMAERHPEQPRWQHQSRGRSRCAPSCSAPTRWSSTASAWPHATSSATGRAPDRLLARLAENEDVLVDTCGELLAAAVKAEPPHHAGRRMAARQLLPDRRADPHRAAAPAARATAASCRGCASGAVGRTAARLRHRARGDLARRRPRRRGQPAPLRRRLPDACTPLQARRAVGDPDHAAPGADREPAPRRRARRRRHASSATSPTRWADQHDRRSPRQRSEEPDPRRSPTWRARSRR